MKEKPEPFEFVDQESDVVDWKSGDECIYQEEGAIVVAWHPEQPVIVIDSDKCGLVGVAVGDISKPLTEQQKKEQLAYELYCEHHKLFKQALVSFGVFNGYQLLKKSWLAIVDKTGYKGE